MNFAVIILGAGASSRMGRPKLLLPWRGSTVIGGIISQWRELGASQIAVVLRPDDDVLNAELNRLNFPSSDRIENPQSERGMFSSILCAANWRGWRPAISHWAVALGDQPQLKTETLRAVMNFSAQNPAAICQPTTDGSARHPVIMPRSAFDELKTTIAPTLKDFLSQSATSRAQCRVADDGLLLDLDTPEDYRRLAGAA
jgi:CTP:molybdopterin cytidylyltransferase MocA